MDIVTTHKNEIAIRPEQPTAIATRREMADNPAIASALGKIEKRIFLSSTKKAIEEYSDEELIKNLEMVFRFVAKDIGYKITDQVDWQYTLTRLMSFLQMYFSNLTLSDIKLAFDLCAAGELDNFLPRDSQGNPDKKHYQNLNVDYISKILNAYKKRQNETFDKAFKALPKEEVTQEMNRDALKHYSEKLYKAFEYYAKNKKLPLLTGVERMIFYDLLEKSGYNVEMKITPEDKHEAYLAFLKRASKGLINKYKAYNVRMKGDEHEDLKPDAILIARDKALIMTFEKMVKDKLTKNDLFNMINSKQ